MKIKFGVMDIGGWFSSKKVLTFTEEQLSLNMARAKASGDKVTAALFEKLRNFLEEVE